MAIKIAGTTVIDDNRELKNLGAPLSTAQGGTGATTLTTNNVILGNGTNAVQFVAPGAIGNVLKSNGTTWTSEAAGASLSGVTHSSTPYTTALGYQAGLNINSNLGVNNTLIGYQSGSLVDTGTRNAALGYQTLANATTADRNVAIGSSALNSLTTSTQGLANIAIGDNAMEFADGNNNIAIGRDVMRYNNNSVSDVIAIGRTVLANNISSNQIAIGYSSLYSATSGGSNTAIGSESADKITTGIQNVVIGFSAASSGTNDLTTGSNNILIGYNAAASSSTTSNEITLGNSSITNFRIPGLNVNWTNTNVPNVTSTGIQTLTNKTLTSPTLNIATASGITLNDGYTEEVFALSGTGPALSPTNGSIQTWVLTGNSTPTAGVWADGQSLTLMIDDGASYTITWTLLVVTWKTDGGVAPMLNTTGATAIQLWKVGTTIYGARVGDA